MHLCWAPQPPTSTAGGGASQTEPRWQIAQTSAIARTVGAEGHGGQARLEPHADTATGPFGASLHKMAAAELAHISPQGLNA